MAAYHEVFKNHHTILPVIHVESPNQAIRNTALAAKEGADGVFLIQMNGNNGLLMDSYKETRLQFQRMFIGVNFNGVSLELALEHLDKTVSGIWSDNAMIDEHSITQHSASLISKKINEVQWNGIYFGGVAFKYQRAVAQEDLTMAAIKAIPYMDVVTTSGEGTGSAPDLEKIRIMKRALDQVPLAIASGITPDNVRSFMPYADSFLVATRILSTGTEDFDPVKLRDLVQNVRG